MSAADRMQPGSYGDKKAMGLSSNIFADNKNGHKRLPRSPYTKATATLQEKSTSTKDANLARAYSEWD